MLKIISGVVAGVAVLFGLTVVFGSWYTVDQTERGVMLRNGAVTGIATPGFHFKLPWVEDVVKIPVRTFTYRWEKMDSYSFDQQQAFLTVSVTMRAAATKVDELYSQFGTVDAAVKQRLTPAVQQQTKIIFGQYTSVRAIQTRAKLNSDIAEALQKSLGHETMLEVESIQLENIEFSPVYLHSIEERMLAEVEVQKLQQNAEREKVSAQITVTKANAAADATLAQAKAEAGAIELKGNAEAKAIEAKAKALAQNGNLVTLIQAQAWDGKLPNVMVPGGAVPMLNLSGK